MQFSMQHGIFSLSVVGSMKFAYKLDEFERTMDARFSLPRAYPFTLGHLSLCTPFPLSATPVHRSVPAHTIFWPLPSDFPLRSHTLITLAGLDAEENMVLSFVVGKNGRKLDYYNFGEISLRVSCFGFSLLSKNRSHLHYILIFLV